jgi:hypothetical protein
VYYSHSSLHISHSLPNPFKAAQLKNHTLNMFTIRHNNPFQQLCIYSIYTLGASATIFSFSVSDYGAP